MVNMGKIFMAGPPQVVGPQTGDCYFNSKSAASQRKMSGDIIDEKSTKPAIGMACEKP
jgi:hypothetical protein